MGTLLRAKEDSNGKFIPAGTEAPPGISCERLSGMMNAIFAHTFDYKRAPTTGRVGQYVNGLKQGARRGDFVPVADPKDFLNNLRKHDVAFDERRRNNVSLISS
jgi:hypothetical protein